MGIVVLLALCPEAAGLILRTALPWRARAAAATHRLPCTDCPAGDCASTPKGEELEEGAARKTKVRTAGYTDRRAQGARRSVSASGRLPGARSERERWAIQQRETIRHARRSRRAAAFWWWTMRRAFAKC